MNSFVILLVVWTIIHQVEGQGLCPTAGVWAGLDTSTIAGTDPGAAPNPPGDPEDTFILYEEGSVNCFGVIAEWRTVVSDPADGCTALNTGEIKFEVWREVTPSTSYELVGNNLFDPANCVDLGAAPGGGGGREISFRIPTSARIPIEDTNVLGWSWFNGLGVFETINDPPVGNILEDVCSGVGFGGNCNGGAMVQRDHLLQARLVRGPAPTIDNLDSMVEVYENEVAFGVTIFTVLASHPSSQAREPDGTPVVGPGSAVEFTFTTTATTAFTLTPNGNQYIGELTVDTNMIYDYETTNQYLITVEATALLQTATGTLTVNILDRNDVHVLDNLDSSAAASVLDPLCQINPIYTVTYIDDDNPATFPAKKFYIRSSVPDPTNAPTNAALPFIINEDSGEVFCTADLETWTDTMATVFAVTIDVTDGMHTVQGDLTITIQQAHTAPDITNLPLAAPQVVLEDVPVPATIFTVAATGPDPANILFSIEDVNPRQYYYYFDIDEVSGDITLTTTAKLDYSIHIPVPPSFTITVGVKDNYQIGATQDLLIDVGWVNQKPVYAPNEYIISIPEECNLDPVCNVTPATPPWTVPGLSFTITDRDLTVPGVTDELSCGILPSFGSNFFQYPENGVNPNPNNCVSMGQIERIDIDDSPQNRQINLTVWVKDAEGMANNDKGDVAHIYITVTDLNDNWPVFQGLPSNTAPHYTKTIPENTPGGVSLFTVSATDKDYDLNGEVVYSMIDFDELAPDIDIDANLHFEVNEITGLVQTKQFVDYEAINPKTIRFYIRASDKGSPTVRTTDITVDIIITNVNDISPVWHCDGYNRPFEAEYVAGDPCFYNDELRADTLINYQVMTIGATDGDTPTADLTYHLLQPNNYFSLGSSSGDIHVINYLGTYVKYILYCYSQDNGSPSLQSQPHLRVRLDTFDPKRQLVDIVIEMDDALFDATQQAIFQQELRNILTPWFPKIEIVGNYKDKTEVSIYALRDTSTFDENNLPYAKQFVDRDELLKVLRKDLHGTPSDVLKTTPFDPFGVILVEPTYPIWIIDTIPGIITLAFICLAILALLLGLILGLCSRYNKCCFKKKPKHSNRNWPKDDKKDNDYDRLSNRSADNDRQAPRSRRASIDTIHSLIYNPR